MNANVIGKRFFVTWLVVFIVWFVAAYVINTMLVDYSSIAHLYRKWEDELKQFDVLILADLLMTGTMVWFYARGVEPKPWLAQGVRFGLAVSLLTVAPMYMRFFVALPIPTSLLIGQLVWFVIAIVLLGVVIAFAYRGAAGARAA